MDPLQALPNADLVERIGVVGYALLLCVATGLALTVWMVKVLVGAATDVTKRLGDSMEKLAAHEATETVLLERIGETVDNNLQLTREIHSDLNRRGGRNAG